jgi:hypothetical protein
MIEAAFKELAKKTLEKTSKELPNFAKNLKPNSVKSFSEADKPLKKSQSEISEMRKTQIEANRNDGAERELKAKKELENEFPAEKGYKIHSETYLRNETGKIVKDNETGSARRIDFTVSKNGEIVKSVEVTSKIAPKEAQISKEDRIRENGGNYIKDKETGELIKIGDHIQTEVRRYE